MARIARTSLAVLIALLVLPLALQPLPSAAQGCGQGPRGTSSLTAAMAPAFGAPRPAAVVAGGGSAVITDPNGEQSPLEFAVAGVIAGDGSADGQIRFVLSKPFARTWGAVPGVDRIRLIGTITAGSVGPAGAATLKGTLTETDFTDGKGVVAEFVNEPFEIVTGGGAVATAFSLQWCLLPVFQVAVPHGALRVYRPQ